ncbi:hypothetical protein FOZ61_006614 [Perkinsus olseni]|uniref:Uncharacterized protein n=1 Tax=Perkinsus olseni TaxID=32597 RepID=A0A7J6MPS0_PEROL|nr:hypothetical protein FOZ61_006614 [Perkinsus olseni]KAF4673396.1 hypothetical protein FOL46_007311 [Perkinsus olseni]
MALWFRGEIPVLHKTYAGRMYSHLRKTTVDPPLRKPGMCQVVHVAAYCERRADLDVDVYVVSKDDWESTAYRSRIHYHDKRLEFDKLTPQGDSHVDTVNLTSRLNRVKRLYELDSSISNVPWRADVFYGVDEDHKREIYFDPETGHCRMEKQQTAEEGKEEKMQMKEMMKRVAESSGPGETENESRLGGNKEGEKRGCGKRGGEGQRAGNGARAPTAKEGEDRKQMRSDWRGRERREREYLEKLWRTLQRGGAKMKEST